MIASNILKKAWRFLPNTFAKKIEETWVDYKHITYISNYIVRKMAQGVPLRLIVELPPRHGKTFFCGKLLPTWFLTIRIKTEVMVLSYSNDIVTEIGTKVRDYFKDSPFLKDVGLSKSSKSNTRFKVGKYDSEFNSQTFDGSVTGKGAQLLIIDDPIKNAEHATKDKLKALIKKFKEFYGRLQGESHIIVFHQRWDVDDLAGYLQRKHEDGGHSDNWDVIRLPAICDSDDDPLGRKIGEPLCPEKFDLKALERIKKNYEGTGLWESMYQQRPLNNTNKKIIDISWFNSFSEFDRKRKYYAFGDVSFKDGGDYTAFLICYIEKRKIHVVDVINKKMDFMEQCEAIREIKLKYNPEFVLEQAANASALESYFRSQFKIKLIPATLSKEMRAKTASVFIKDGHVLLYDKMAIMEAFIDQIRNFPKVKNDDMVDVLSLAVLYLLGKERTLLDILEDRLKGKLCA